MILLRVVPLILLGLVLQLHCIIAGNHDFAARSRIDFAACSPPIIFTVRPRPAPWPCFCSWIVVSWHSRRPSFPSRFRFQHFPKFRQNLISRKSHLAKILSCFCISCNFNFFFSCLLVFFPLFFIFFPCFSCFSGKNYVSCLVSFPIYAHFLSQILSPFPFLVSNSVSFLISRSISRLVSFSKNWSCPPLVRLTRSKINDGRP